MFLEIDRVLAPSVDRPFTHVLKPAGTSGFEFLPVIEWQALALGAGAGFAAPATALVPMPDGMPPALLVERFDIRTRPEDNRLIALEDFASMLGVPTEAKYDGTMERVAIPAIVPKSSSAAEAAAMARSLIAQRLGEFD